VTPDLLAPVCFLAAALLVLAGVVKVVRPRSTAQALLDAGLPGSLAIARGAGVVEVCVGIWALVAPASGGAIALGLLYLLFAGFLGYVLHAHPEAGSCGCAGPTPVPPSRLHLVLNVVAGTVGLAYAAIGGPSTATWLDGLGWAAVPVVAGLALAGWLAVVAVTQAPAAFRAWEAPVQDHDAEPQGHDHAIADHELIAAGVEPGHPSLWPGVKEAG
jgi:hypothetical protein